MVCLCSRAARQQYSKKELDLRRLTDCRSFSRPGVTVITGHHHRPLEQQHGHIQMAFEHSIAKQLDLQLFRDDDDEEDLLYKKKLQALVNGEVTPSKAATDLDAWIVDDANERLKELMKRPDPRNLTTEEEEQGMSLRAITPNASGNIEMVFPSIAKLCSAFPPYHPGQDRIIQFLEALRAMPDHQVPDGIPAEDPDNDDHMITLWPFGGNWMALAEVFRREANGMFSWLLFVDSRDP